MSACLPQGNRAPAIAVNSSFTADPLTPLTLNAEVSDDGRPGASLSLSWSKASGPGAVSFGNPSRARTTATFSRSGEYLLRLLAEDGELSSSAEVRVRVLDAGRTPVTALRQVGSFATGSAGGVYGGAPLLIPSTDPAGVAFHPPTGHLFIADSEIDEVAEAFARVQANVFEVSPQGDTLYNRWDLTEEAGGDNNEPAGIAYCTHDGHFYLSNDSKQLLYRYALSGGRLELRDQIFTAPVSQDPEGVACDPETGRLYVIGGAGINVAVYSHSTDFKLEGEFNLALTAGAPQGVPSDPEGIAFDPASRQLFVVSAPDEAVFVYTTAGVFVRKFGLATLSPRPLSPQGLTIGPASSIPGATSLYVADGGRDNNKYPSERDGRIYELLMVRAPK